MPFLIERPADPVPAANRVEGDVLLIGRGTNAGLRLDDEAVALEHARVERDPAGYQLVDLASITGTYLNGKPVTEAYLKDGDVLGLGASRIRVRWRAPADPLALEVRPAVAESVTPAVQAPEVDYAGAYTLRRPFLTKGALAVLLTLAAAGALAALPLAKAWKAFQPGSTSEAHTRKGVGCFDCHAPWRGPATASCSGCHPRLDHQPTQVSTPDCSDCHFEHRGQNRLVLVNDASCVACHGNLRVKEGGSPRFARNVTAFPEGHATFSVTQPGGARLPVAEAVARQADPGTLRLDHARHLKPGLIGPEGRETLTCASCHMPGDSPTGIKAVHYEQHCQRCHRLTFDDARPDEEAPHAEPRIVHDRLVALYGVNESQMGSFRERRRISVRSPGATMGLNLSARVLYQVQEAENLLYRTNCVKCHAMDLDTRPFPTVAPARLQADWLPFSHFDHRPHADVKGLTCETCHTRARASSATADVLLPGIEACGGCHGGGKPPGKAELRSARNDCRGCHAYHPRQQGARG
jgi:FHA domain/Cytochrome c7 and related cytochrome c